MFSPEFASPVLLSTCRRPVDESLAGFIDSVFDGRPLWANRGPVPHMPAMNLREQGDNLLLECELPGVAPEDVDLQATGDEIRLTVKRKDRATSEKPSQKWLRRERACGQFSRSIKLPYELDAENVQASLQDGVLRASMPKAPHSRPHRVKLLGRETRS